MRSLATLDKEVQGVIVVFADFQIQSKVVSFPGQTGDYLVIHMGVGVTKCSIFMF